MEVVEDPRESTWCVDRAGGGGGSTWRGLASARRAGRGGCLNRQSWTANSLLVRRWGCGLWGAWREGEGCVCMMD